MVQDKRIPLLRFFSSSSEPLTCARALALSRVSLEVLVWPIWRMIDQFSGAVLLYLLPLFVLKRTSR